MHVAEIRMQMDKGEDTDVDLVKLRLLPRTIVVEVIENKEENKNPVRDYSDPSPKALSLSADSLLRTRIRELGARFAIPRRNSSAGRMNLWDSALQWVRSTARGLQVSIEPEGLKITGSATGATTSQKPGDRPKLILGVASQIQTFEVSKGESARQLMKRIATKLGKTHDIDAEAHSETEVQLHIH